jgi:D-alanyl-D-alanine carboxypeptidase
MPVKTRILRPLGLEGTYLPGTSPFLPEPHLRAYARASARDEERIIDVTVQNPSRAWASGDIISTTSDILRFYRALFNGKILAPAQLCNLMTTVPSDNDRQYGLGIFTYCAGDAITVWGNSGSFGCYVSFAIQTEDLENAVAIAAVPRNGQALPRIKSFCATAITAGP